MSQCEDAFGTYEKCDFAEGMELEKKEQKKAPKGAPSHLPLSPERAIALLYVLLAVAFVFFMALTIVNLQRVSAVWEELKRARMHTESSHTTAWYNLSEVQHSLGQQLSGDLQVIQGQLLRVSREVENVWRNLTQCRAECGEELSDRLRVLAAEKPWLEVVLRQLTEVEQEQSRALALLNASLEETRGLSARFEALRLRAGCPTGWQEFATSCYFFSTDAKPWLTARNYCTNHKAHLVIIDNEEENGFLARHITDNQVFWLGLSDTESEGNWQWVDRRSRSFLSWNNGEPNDAGHDGEDCAIIYSNGRWNDIGCSSNEAWICEQTF
ncbi:asialoglycoprotein receptor 1-like isoform X2 [Cuculus canorus]|uniref:asialoglycoprotein receptor 1-like isoform X2 n=1 Tax=Cuculus canorus TaxID=55661 RepID=UPI0023AB3B28|nr:asialoglycoprotein receptor 1-like isoform X2 [Cuculus canorus]